MENNDAPRPKGPSKGKGPRGPRPLMSIRPGPRGPHPYGFRPPPFGPRNFRPPPGPRFFPLRPPMLRGPLPPPRLSLHPRPLRGMPRGPPRLPHPAMAGKPPFMRFPPRMPGGPRQRLPPPPMMRPRMPMKRSGPQHSPPEHVSPPKKKPNQEIDFTDDSFDIQSSKLGTAF